MFIVGTAGSGKSLLASAFSEWLKISGQDVAILNLDPGVVTLPYTPDVDIRDYVSIEKLMKEYKLGPNGALILAADLIADQVETLSSEIQEINADLTIVDTPGQIELFAFRASGPYIAKELVGELKVILYLFDSVFSSTPLNYVSNLFLSAAVYNRFLLPQIHILSKCDLLPTEKVDYIVEWSTDPEVLENAIDKELEGAKRLLSRDMTNSINRLGLHFLLVPVSAKSNEGFINLNAYLERIFAGGDKFTQ
ncbi:ATP/GTP-binding protein [Candidatus Bathyarchaeota archaeon]|nr:ATP/GTP-binding protein [Candidatus Bathyarchaeota archaeon]